MEAKLLTNLEGELGLILTPESSEERDLLILCVQGDSFSTTIEPLIRVTEVKPAEPPTEKAERPTLKVLEARLNRVYPRAAVTGKRHGDRRLVYRRCSVYVSAGAVPKIAVKYEPPAGISTPEKARYFKFGEESKAMRYVASLNGWW